MMLFIKLVTSHRWSVVTISARSWLLLHTLWYKQDWCDPFSSGYKLQDHGFCLANTRARLFTSYSSRSQVSPASPSPETSWYWCQWKSSTKCSNKQTWQRLRSPSWRSGEDEARTSQRHKLLARGSETNCQTWTLKWRVCEGRKLNCSYGTIDFGQKSRLSKRGPWLRKTLSTSDIVRSMGLLSPVRHISSMWMAAKSCWSLGSILGSFWWSKVASCSVALYHIF